MATLSAAEATRGFAAAGSASRLQVLRTLVRAGPQGLSTSEIQARTDIAASTLAHHLRHLAEGELITRIKVGRSVITHANYPRIEALAQFLMSECCADTNGQCE